MILIGLPFIVMAGLLMQTPVEGKRPLKPGEVVHMFTFDKDKSGALPDAWRLPQPAAGKKAAEWTVVADPAAPSPPHAFALTKLAEEPTGFNIVMLKELKSRVFGITVRLKAISGKEDQGGGLLWRAVDDQNYFVARINPLEGNLRVYKVVDGKRTQLGTVDVETDTGKWHTLEVISLGDGFVCALDRRWTVQVADRSFPEPGFVGLWTKSDAMTAFDDFEFKVQDKR